MKTIWKFPVQPEPLFEIQLPEGAKVLCVQVQRDEPFIWVALDTDKPKVQRVFSVCATGGRMIGGMEGDTYIGTFQMQGGSLVWHLFEIGMGDN